MRDRKHTFLPLPGYANIKALLIILNAFESFKLLTKNTQFTCSNFLNFFASRENSQSTESNANHARDVQRLNQEHGISMRFLNPHLERISSAISESYIEACREYIYSPNNTESNKVGKDLKAICRKFKKDGDAIFLLKKLFKLHEDCNSAGEEASSALQEALERYTFTRIEITVRRTAVRADSGEHDTDLANSGQETGIRLAQDNSLKDKDSSATENQFNKIVDDKFKEELAEKLRKTFIEKFGVNLDIDLDADFKNKYENEFNDELKNAFIDIFREKFKEKEQAKAQAQAATETTTTTTTTTAPSDNGEQLAARAAVTQNETLTTSAVPVADGDAEPSSHAMLLSIAGPGAGLGQQGALSDDMSVDLLADIVAPSFDPYAFQ